MDRQTIALIFQEGGKFITELIRTRPFKTTTTTKQPLKIVEETATIEEGKASSAEAKTVEGTACLPCVNNHFSVCSGLISDEALRMARRHGITEEEIKRINLCLDQLNGMEREDLAVEKIATLPQWEKDLAIYAQNESASIRHKLENLRSVDDLENAALQIKKARSKIGKDYFKEKLARMPKEEKQKLAEKAIEKLEEE